MVWQIVNSAASIVIFFILVVVFFKFHVFKKQQEQKQLAQLQKNNDLATKLDTSLSLNTRQQQKLAVYEQQLSELAQTLQDSKNGYQPLFEQIDDLKGQQEQLSNIVQLIQSESSEQKLYGRAKKMIEMGADVEELITECEVPRAEAELLMSLYKKQNTSF